MRAPKVVIVGGGFGGVNAAKALSGTSAEITLIDRRNHHLFQPLLYQVASGHLAPADIAPPLRSLFKGKRNVRVVLGEVADFDVVRQEVVLRDGRVPYDVAIVAAGASTHYFNHPEWQRWAPPLKSVEDAIEIRRRVLLAFEMAEKAPDAATARAWLTFVIIGGGPTGVEMAGALAEVARNALRNEFRRIDPADARILLVQSPDAILPTYDRELSKKGALALSAMGVSVQTGARISAVDPLGVVLQRGELSEFVAARTVVWAAGVKASPLGEALARALDVELDRLGRVPVSSHLTVAGTDNLFVIGDLAHAVGADGEPLPGVAQVAMQQGRYVAELLRRRWQGLPTEPFRYKDRGNMAQIGRQTAVVELGRLRTVGLLAWHLWWIVHLVYLVGCQNRLVVLTRWVWTYFTYDRPSLLITQRSVPSPELDEWRGESDSAEAPASMVSS